MQCVDVDPVEDVLHNRIIW